MPKFGAFKLGANGKSLSDMRENRIVNNPDKLFWKIEGRLRVLALEKYERDGATCDKEKFVALYLSACLYELKRNPERFRK